MAKRGYNRGMVVATAAEDKEKEEERGGVEITTETRTNNDTQK